MLYYKVNNWRIVYKCAQTENTAGTGEGCGVRRGAAGAVMRTVWDAPDRISRGTAKGGAADGTPVKAPAGNGGQYGFPCMMKGE